MANRGPAPRRRRLGRVAQLDRLEQAVTVHRHGALADGRLRVKWQPIYLDGGREVLGGGAVAALETVQYAEVLLVVELHTGVLAHGAARRLDRSGWRLEEGILERGVAAVDVPIELECKASVRLGQLANVLAAPLEGRLQWRGGALQQWASTGTVDFVEVFAGEGELSIALAREGLSVGAGIDSRRPAYGRSWDLVRPEAQEQLEWLLTNVLKPRGLHVATPCTPWCILGANRPDKAARALLLLSVRLLRRQDQLGFLGSFETPLGSRLVKEKEWDSHWRRWKYWSSNLQGWVNGYIAT